MLGSMKTYPAEHWTALGQWVATARLQAGHSDTQAWASRVGRSTRIVLGLERGESVGAKTLEAVALALGINQRVLYTILESGYPTDPWADPRGIRRPVHQNDTDALAALATWVRSAATDGFETPPPTTALTLWDFDQLVEGVRAKYESDMDMREYESAVAARDIDDLFARLAEGGDGNVDADDHAGDPAPTKVGREQYVPAADEQEIDPLDEAEETERST